MIVIHETAVPYYFFEPTYYYNTVKFIDFVNMSRKYLLMGVPHVQYYNDSAGAPKDSKISSITHRKYKTYNSAVLIEPDKNKNEYQIHKKVKLVPFSENVPYSNTFPFLSKWIRWGVGISSWNTGDSLLIFKLNDQLYHKNLRFETLVCFESVFSDYVCEGVKNGSEFLVIITNDGWFGKSSGPVQHQQFAVLRAIENRKWIIRAAQTGISCFIDPLGNTYDKLPLDTKGIIVKNIIANEEQTFYSLHGDMIGCAGYYIGIISFPLGLIFYILKRRKSSTVS
jgi:apolipoprotein N-acyltransferase